MIKVNYTYIILYFIMKENLIFDVLYLLLIKTAYLKDTGMKMVTLGLRL